MNVLALDFRDRFNVLVTDKLPSLEIYIEDSAGRIFSHKNPDEINKTGQLTAREQAVKDATNVNQERSVSYTSKDGPNNVISIDDSLLAGLS